jgi:hypothetical protein
VADTLIPLDLPAGLYRNGTVYQSKGRWHDGNLVRFIQGTIQPIGGWRYLADDTGSALAALSGVPRGVLSWAGDGGAKYLGVGTTQKLYLLAAGAMHDITPVGFTPSTSDDSVPTTAGGKYGAGAYGAGAYGTGSAASTITEASTWQLDNFGISMVGACTSDNKLYVWTSDPTVKAAVPANAPAFVSGCVVTPEGFIVAIGYAKSLGTASVRSVSWAAQGTTTVWDSHITNSAGDFDLTTQGRILCGKRTKKETLFWTDCDLHVMTYIGGPLVYAFDQAGEKCGAISARSPIVIDTRAIWMGHRNFFTYDGFVKPISCEVADYVFNDFNEAQSAKVWGTSVAEFGEVWWFYPSAASSDCDRYVVYNYLEGHWSVGKLRRSAGCDAAPLVNPVMMTPDGHALEHEVLSSHFTTSTETSNVARLESGPVELGNGDRLMSVQRLVPDENTLGDVQATLYSALTPTAAEEVHGPYPVASETSVRLNARQVRVRLDEVRPTPWRVGVLRVGVIPSSRR